MALLYPLAGLLMLIGTLVYLHAVAKFYGIVAAERPDWVDRRGSLSFFYTGMPRLSDPNVSMAVVGLAFGSRWRELRSASAAKYVRRIRVLLPALLAVFAGALVAIAVGTP